MTIYIVGWQQSYTAVQEWEFTDK